MPVRCRKLFWPAVVLIAVIFSALAFVLARTREVILPVAEQSLLAASRTEGSPPRLVTPKTPERQTSEQLTAAPARSDAAAAGQASAEEVEVEVITVRAGGFEPLELTRPQGAFLLAIINHSGDSELALKLDGVHGNRVHEVRLPKGRVRWNKVFDLPPGDYVLSEENHPDWICRIKLTPR
jgi:hypothetical protein